MKIVLEFSDDVFRDVIRYLEGRYFTDRFNLKEMINSALILWFENEYDRIWPRDKLSKLAIEIARKLTSKPIKIKEVI